MSVLRQTDTTLPIFLWETYFYIIISPFTFSFGDTL